MEKIIRAILFMSILAVTSTVAYSADYYLSPNDDWFPILTGDNLQAGDQIIFSEGVYSDGRRLSISHLGTAQAPIIIRSENDSTVTITRPNANQNVINIEGAQHLIFRGIEVTGGSAGIRIGSKLFDGVKRQAEFITIEDCHIHHIDEAAVTANFVGDINTGHKFLSNEIHHTGGKGEGFYLGSNNDGTGNTTSVFRDGLIEGNYIHHLNGSAVEQGDGIEIKDGSYNNIIIRDNVIHDINYPGILVYGTDGNPPNIIEGNVIWASGDNGIQAASEAIIRNNIIFDSSGSGIQSQEQQSAIPGNLTIVHNTLFTNAGRTAIRVNQPVNGVLSGTIVIANNALYAMGSGLALRLPNLANFSISGNIGVGSAQPAQPINAWNPGGNPDNDFVDWTNKDVFPADNSLLIGNADANYVSTSDFNVSSRAGGFDVGAYLYQSSGNPGWQIEAGFKQALVAELDTDQDGIPDSLDNCTEIANSDQRDSNGDGYGNICDADLDNNGSVSFSDLDLFKSAFSSNDPDADFDGNGSVSFSDLDIFRRLFGRSPGSSGN